VGPPAPSCAAWYACSSKDSVGLRREKRESTENEERDMLDLHDSVSAGAGDGFAGDCSEALYIAQDT